MKLAERKDNQIITLYPKYLETINDPNNDLFTDGIFTTDVAIITANDYISFFKKIKRKPWTKKQLKKIVPKKLLWWGRAAAKQRKTADR